MAASICRGKLWLRERALVAPALARVQRIPSPERRSRTSLDLDQCPLFERPAGPEQAVMPHADGWFPAVRGAMLESTRVRGGSLSQTASTASRSEVLLFP